MEALRLSWTFLLERNKKVVVVGVSESGSPVLLFRTVNNKSLFYMILADWFLLSERFSTLQRYFAAATRKNKEKKRQIDCQEIEFSGTNFNACTRERKTLELWYKSNWLDTLLARQPTRFVLTSSEVISLIKIQLQIQQALDIMKKPIEPIIYARTEDNFEELLQFLVPKDNGFPPSTTTPPAPIHPHQ